MRKFEGREKLFLKKVSPSPDIGKEYIAVIDILQKVYMG